MAIAVGIIALIFLLLFAWRSWRNAAPAAAGPPPTAVAATLIRPVDAPVSLEAVGSLRAVEEVILAPEVAGRVNALLFQPGTRVSAEIGRESGREKEWREWKIWVGAETLKKNITYLSKLI